MVSMLEMRGSGARRSEESRWKAPAATENLGQLGCSEPSCRPAHRRFSFWIACRPLFSSSPFPRSEEGTLQLPNPVPCPAPTPRGLSFDPWECFSRTTHVPLCGEPSVRAHCWPPVCPHSVLRGFLIIGRGNGCAQPSPILSPLLSWNPDSHMESSLFLLLHAGCLLAETCPPCGVSRGLWLAE